MSKILVVRQQNASVDLYLSEETMDRRAVLYDIPCHTMSDQFDSHTLTSRQSHTLEN